MLSNVGYIRGRGQQFLVAPSVFREPLTLSRAQTGGVQSSALTADGSSLAFYFADAPRFNGSAQRLLIEGPRTNGFNNPWLEGAIPGIPGTLPTNTNTSFFQGLSREIVGIGTENNIPYVDLRFFGTATSGSFSRFGLADPRATGLNISGNLINTFSAYVKLVSGSLDQISSVRLVAAGRNASNVEVAGQVALMNFTPTSAALGTQRRITTFTPSNISVVYGGWGIDILRDATATVDVTLRIGLPQHELGAFASSPILPPVGTPGASTRGADIVAAPLSSLGIAANGACTVLWSGVIPNFIAGGVHTIACLDDGSVNNRFTMRFDQASGQLQSMRALAGASATANAGAITADVPFKGGMNIDGAGRAGVSLNGGAVAAVTGGPTSGLTQLRLGNIFDASTPMWGETGRLRILPYSVSDAELQSLVGALP